MEKESIISIKTIIVITIIIIIIGITIYLIYSFNKSSEIIQSDNSNVVSSINDDIPTTRSIKIDPNRSNITLPPLLKMMTASSIFKLRSHAIFNSIAIQTDNNLYITTNIFGDPLNLIRLRITDNITFTSIIQQKSTNYFVGISKINNFLYIIRDLINLTNNTILPIRLDKDQTMKVLSIIEINNGSFLVIDINNNLYALPNLTTSPLKFTKINTTHIFISILQLDGNNYVGIKKTDNRLYEFTLLTDTPIKLPCTTPLLHITQAIDGTLLGITKANQLFTMDNINIKDLIISPSPALLTVSMYII